MIGRFAGTGALVDVSLKGLVTIAAAALLVGAVVAECLDRAAWKRRGTPFIATKRGESRKLDWIDTVCVVDIIRWGCTGQCTPEYESIGNSDEESLGQERLSMDAGSMDAVGNVGHVFDLRAWS